VQCRVLTGVLDGGGVTNIIGTNMPCGINLAVGSLDCQVAYQVSHTGTASGTGTSLTVASVAGM
jgi:hypothetical protein